MGFWSDLFGSDSDSKALDELIARPLIGVQGDGTFALDIVGESHFQSALNNIAGGKTPDGHQIQTESLLILDDDNQHDDKAVMVAINGNIVGYLPRKLARQHRNQIAEAGLSNANAECAALITGGWNRGGGDVGYYGVKLDYPINVGM